MSGQRGLTAAAFIAAGGVGYYLYNAGGDPQAAEKAMKGKLSLAVVINPLTCDSRCP